MEYDFFSRVNPCKHNRLNLFCVLKFIEHCLSILVVINVFVVVCVSSEFFVSQNLVPNNENFGKLKFVSSEKEYNENLQSASGEVVQIDMPFGVTYYENSHFISAGNNVLLAVFSGTVGDINFDGSIKSFVLTCKDFCAVYSGYFLLGVKENQKVVSGQKLGFSFDGIVTIKFMVLGEEVLGEKLFTI